MQQVFDELWSQELVYQKSGKMDKIPGRPAYPRPAGLAPQHTMPRNFSRVIMSKNPSQSNLVSSKFTNKDRKAWAMEGWVHFQCPNAVSRPKPPWARMCNRWLMRQWNGGPRGAKPRPAGLREAVRPNNHVLWTQSSSTDFQETIQAVHKKSVARWWDPQAGRPRGGRPAPPCSGLCSTSHGSYINRPSCL